MKIVPYTKSKTYLVSSSQLLTRAFIVTFSCCIVSRMAFDSEFFLRIKSLKKIRHSNIFIKYHNGQGEPGGFDPSSFTYLKKQGIMASKTVNICRARFVPESYAITKTHKEIHSKMEIDSGSPIQQKSKAIKGFFIRTNSIICNKSLWPSFKVQSSYEIKEVHTYYLI